MAQAIETPFDKPLEEDVLLEPVDSANVIDTLKNAENVYKSFLYLRKMYSEFPAKKNIRSMATVSYADYTVVTVPEKSNYLLINNYSTSTAGIKINGGEYILQAGEKQEFPVIAPDTTVVPAVTGDTVEIRGDVSYIFQNIQEY